MNGQQNSKNQQKKPTKEDIYITLASYFLPLAMYLLAGDKSIKRVHGREKVEITRKLEITIMVWLLKNNVTPEKYSEVYQEVHNTEHNSHTHPEKQRETAQHENKMIDAITRYLYDTIKQTSDNVATQIQQYLYENGPVTAPYIPDITDTHLRTAAPTPSNSNQYITPDNIHLDTGNCHYGKEDAVPPSDTDMDFLACLGPPNEAELALLPMSDSDFFGNKIQTASVPGKDLTNHTPDNNIDLGFPLVNNVPHRQNLSSSIFNDDFDLSFLNNIGTPKGTPNPKRKVESTEIILEKVITASKNKVNDELKKIEDVFKLHNEKIYTHLVFVIECIFNDLYDNAKIYM